MEKLYIQNQLKSIKSNYVEICYIIKLRGVDNYGTFISINYAKK
jgi:hypothetical protein